MTNLIFEVNGTSRVVSGDLWREEYIFFDLTKFQNELTKATIKALDRLGAFFTITILTIAKREDNSVEWMRRIGIIDSKGQDVAFTESSSTERRVHTRSYSNNIKGPKVAWTTTTTTSSSSIEQSERDEWRV